jgi:glycosyltransferase involved in cell wall biosynthesis
VTPSISVIVPVFNGEKYLAEAIGSCLRQTRPASEIILVDDGSTDRSREIARSLTSRLRYEFQEHAGAGAARNRGVKIASGDYLAFLDADDYWNPEKLAVQADYLDRNIGCDLVFGKVRAFYSPDLSETERAALVPLPPEMIGRVPGSALIRRRSFRQVGPFLTQWEAGEFLDWYGRAKLAGLREASTGGAILFRRIHRNNYMRQHPASRADYLKILKSALDRKRQAGG